MLVHLLALEVENISRNRIITRLKKATAEKGEVSLEDRQTDATFVDFKAVITDVT